MLSSTFSQSAAAPSAPTMLTVVSGSLTNTSVKVAWKPPTSDGGEEVCYKVYYREKDFPFMPKTYVGRTCGLMMLITGLKPVTEYVVFVEACNSVSDQHGHEELRTAEVMIPKTKEGGK